MKFQNNGGKGKNQGMFLYFLTGVICCTEEYFTYKIAANFVLRGDQTEPVGKPMTTERG